MKRFFIAVAMCATLVACGGSDALYTENGRGRVYEDVNGDFDTLAYAVGMNFGLSALLQQADLELDGDILAEAIYDEAMQPYMRYDAIKENHDLIEKFMNNNVRNYMAAKRRNSMIATTMRDTLYMPELYTEGYTPELISRSMGMDMGCVISNLSFPVNIHWVLDAVNDAKSVESRATIDRDMKLTIKQMSSVVNDYLYKKLPEYSAEMSDKWLERVSKMEGVHPFEVEGATLYYRINERGSDIRSKNIQDTVAFTYEVFSRRGALVESTADRVRQIRRNIELVKNDKELKDSIRNMRLERYESQLAQAACPTIPLNHFMIKGAKYAMELIGEGGNMTLWIPAELAYGARGNSSVLPNEAVVMNVSLHKVVEGALDANSGIQVLPAGVRSIDRIEPGKPLKSTATKGDSKSIVIEKAKK